MIFRQLKRVLIKARDVLQTQGAGSLVRQVLVSIRKFLFRYGHYYIYEHTLKERDEAGFLPQLDDFATYIIRNHEEAEEVEAATGYDLRRRMVDVSEKLDKGAIAVFVFTRGKPVHFGWIAFSREAQKTFDTVPYKVDYSGGQACTGGSFTIPDYRSKGLMAYGYFKRFQLLREMGITTTRNAVRVENIASQNVHAKFGPKILAEGRRLTVLGITFWKETPYVAAGEPD